MQGELKERVCVFAKTAAQDPDMGPMGLFGNNMCFRAHVLNPFVAGLTAENKQLLTFTEVLYCC